MARFYAKNRRDGSRLLSSAVTIGFIGLIGFSHPLGQFVAITAGLVSVYWWSCYRRLDH